MKKNKKQTMTTILCLLMISMLLLGGCKKKEEEVFVPDEQEVTQEEVSENTEEAEEPKNTDEPTEKEPVQNTDVQASEYTAPEADHEGIDMIILGVGSNEGQVSATWYSKSQNPGKFVVAKAAEMNGTTFPVTMLSGDSAPYNANYESFFANAATVDGLEADTEYCYMVGNADGWSAVRRFKTAPEGQLNVLVTGDIQLGTGDDDHVNVDRWHKVAADTASRFSDYQLHLNMGDVTYVPEDSFYPSVVNTPIFSGYPNGVVRGNHDMGPAFAQHFVRPNQTEWGKEDDPVNGNYWYRYGDVLFMCLNYQVEGIDIQLEHRYFIKEALEKNPDCKWTVVMMHYSPFSSVEKYQDYSNENREDWLAVFDEFGIDVVLNGHDHAYTRTHIVKGGQAQVSDAASVTNPDGTLYVTFSSASGSQYHEVNPSPWAAKCMQTKTPHVSTLDFTDHSMKLTVYEADTWNVLDAFEIIKE